MRRTTGRCRARFSAHARVPGRTSRTRRRASRWRRGWLWGRGSWSTPHPGQVRREQVLGDPGRALLQPVAHLPERLVALEPGGLIPRAGAFQPGPVDDAAVGDDRVAGEAVGADLRPVERCRVADDLDKAADNEVDAFVGDLGAGVFVEVAGGGVGAGVEHRSPDAGGEPHLDHQTARLRALRPNAATARSRMSARPAPEALRTLSPDPTVRAYPDPSWSRLLRASAAARAATRPGTTWRGVAPPFVGGAGGGAPRPPSAGG